MLATAGGQECYLLSSVTRGQMSSVSLHVVHRKVWSKTKASVFNQNMALAVSRAEKTVGGLFAVQFEAEGHGMVLKLGIKGGERWAGRIQHQLPLLLPQCGEEVMARSESSSADVTRQTYTITVICCRQG